MCISRHRYYRGRRIGSRIDQVKTQVQDEQLEDNICFKLSIYCVHGYVKICVKRVSPIVEYGEQSTRLHRASSIRKVVQLEKIKIDISLLKWNAQGKGMI
jgi:hypothetical protein